MAKKIGITFAVYNNISLTLKCLDSIYNNGSKNELFVVVVDNGSTDGSAGRIALEFSEVEVIKNNKNLGCSRAWNQGLSRCFEEECDFLTLTQNDVIISEGVIDESVKYLKENEHDIKLVSPFTINVPFTSGKNLTQVELNIIAEKAKNKYGGSIHRFFCMYYFTMFPDVFDRFKFDENFKKVLYEDSDFYDTLSLNKISSCGNMDLGLLFHRYNATQVIVNNSDHVRNKNYFNKKWDKDRDQMVKNREEILRKMPINMEYPTCKKTYVFFDVEEAGLHKWK